MTEHTVYDQSWVATGSAGTVGSILRYGDDYSIRLRGDESLRGPYGSLDAAKGALTAALGPGADRPEFREH
ncbi:MAG: methyltransferase [Microcella sp.]